MYVSCNSAILNLTPKTPSLTMIFVSINYIYYITILTLLDNTDTILDKLHNLYHIFSTIQM